MTELIDYFVYPHRGPGPDHDRYEHRYLRNIKPFKWSGGKRLLIWVAIHCEHFPMDMPAKPFKPLGGMDRFYPSVWDYTTRDYGQRVGIYRLIDVLDRHNVQPTVAMNSAIASRYPYLIEQIINRNWEITASGVDMGKLHHGELPIEKEREYVEEAFDTLRRLSGQPVTGWHSPGHSQSLNTPELVAAAGADYIADWINDELPYPFATKGGTLTQMPLSYDMSDRKIIFLHNQSAEEYRKQISDAFKFLHQESDEYGGRILSLSLSPWVIGQPSRIRVLDDLLGEFLAHEGVGTATGHEILEQWKSIADSNS